MIVIVLISILVGAIIIGVLFLLTMKQIAFQQSLKIGDAVQYKGKPAKIIGYSNGKFIVEVEISGMELSSLD